MELIKSPSSSTVTSPSVLVFNDSTEWMNEFLDELQDMNIKIFWAFNNFKGWEDTIIQKIDLIIFLFPLDYPDPWNAYRMGQSLPAPVIVGMNEGNELEELVGNYHIYRDGASIGLAVKNFFFAS